MAAALAVALVKMAKGAQSELRYHAPIGADLDAKPPMPLAITVRVVDWVIVETVPLTENEVVRRELVRAPKGASYERPTVFSTAMVRYTVREQAARRTKRPLQDRHALGPRCGGGGGPQACRCTGDREHVGLAAFPLLVAAC